MTESPSFTVNKSRLHITAGGFDFYLVRDGYYRLDGGSMYGMVPKAIWETIEKYDEKNRLYMGMNCLLAAGRGKVYLADTGIGDKFDEKRKAIYGIEKEKNLLEEIADAGFKPEDITDVIPTHLHFDHAGWIQDNEGKLTFPNAVYHVQKTEWEEALNPHPRFKDSYLMNFYSALKDSPALHLLDGDEVIDNTVRVKLTAGHSKGHQIVIFETGEKTVAHFGDIAALASQVRTNWTCGFDRFPEETVTVKTPLLEEAFEGGWIVVTAHDRTIHAGQLEKVRGNFHLKKLI
ncbi:MAG: MBL fold metallo-hydrolase [Firmicutes bacterium]|nr:MBL fold metallo-hydrolase [Bacillota bacterium]